MRIKGFYNFYLKKQLKSFIKHLFISNLPTIEIVGYQQLKKHNLSDLRIKNGSSD